MLNSYHPNIKFIVEENPDHFLDTSFIHQEGSFTTKVYQKPGKLQVRWKSAFPERWKCNTILDVLHRTKRTASDWKAEVKAIKQSFVKAIPREIKKMELFMISKTQKAMKQ